MEKPTICTVDIFTGETQTREMTEDEYAELLASLVSGMPEEPA